MHYYVDVKAQCLVSLNLNIGKSVKDLILSFLKISTQTKNWRKIQVHMLLSMSSRQGFLTEQMGISNLARLDGKGLIKKKESHLNRITARYVLFIFVVSAVVSLNAPWHSVSYS